MLPVRRTSGAELAKGIPALGYNACHAAFSIAPYPRLHQVGTGGPTETLPDPRAAPLSQTCPTITFRRQTKIRAFPAAKRSRQRRSAPRSRTAARPRDRHTSGIPSNPAPGARTARSGLIRSTLRGSERFARKGRSSAPGSGCSAAANNNTERSGNFALLFRPYRAGRSARLLPASYFRFIFRRTITSP